MQSGRATSSQGLDVTQAFERTGGDLPAGPSRALIIGELIGRYQLRRPIGQGGMGQVYLARDVVLGRSVALKLVRSEAVSPAQTERILQEARAIAALNHPHIVQLYDVGQHEQGLYLALEHIDGETLRERAARGPLSIDEVLRHTRAIAEALTHAHAHGIYHCDLKPANVMIGRDGRLRVVDFGIAQTADVTNRQIAGTPEWMAPEQRHGQAQASSDVWALALLMLHLLHLGQDGAEPLHRAGLTMAEQAELEALKLPPVLLPLLQRSLALAPDARPRAEEWRLTLSELLTVRSGGSLEHDPYRGLLAFQEEDARSFFGRETDIDELLERLRDEPCLPVLGPSGIGKSSLVFAGLVPRLRAQEPWTVLSLRPGANPIGALARQVTQALHESAVARGARREIVELEAQLRETPTLLAARLATLAAATGTRVLLIVDQLEEIFTHVTDEEQRGRFLHMVLSAADDPLDPVRVVLTLRDDFLGRIPQLRSLYVVRHLTAADLRRIILSPLEQLGYQLDAPAIADEMIEEASQSHAALPLLQFACRMLWEGRDPATRHLRRSTYVAMGGFSGAVASHAETALRQLTAEEHRLARLLLLRLSADGARIAVPRSQLAAVAPAADAVIDRLLAARLLVLHTPGDASEPVVEVAHESLLSSWPQLARWIESSSEELRLHHELQDAVKQWQRRGSAALASWSVEELAGIRRRIAQLAIVIPPQEQALLDGVAAHHRMRRRRWMGKLIASTALVSIAVVALFLWFSSFQLRERKARGNFGRVELVLRPFSLTASAQTLWLDASELPELELTLHAAELHDEHRPGPALPAEVVHLGPRRLRAGALELLLEAPGGLAFLRIDGRGRRGERCGPAWIRLRSLPGYSHSVHAAAPRLTLAIPTCEATRWNQVEIEAGPFWYGGSGSPVSPFFGAPDYTQPLELIELARFAIDRTEVSNAAFAPFAAMESITGYRAPRYAEDDVHAADDAPERPVSSIDAFAAEAFCRFLGKQLPSDLQWTKAARGGLAIRGVPNPAPMRLYPWGATLRRDCVNLGGIEDGHRWVAPVSAFTCGASPYGVLQLAGNVEEWIALEGQRDPTVRLRALRAGSAESPAELDHHTTIFRNHRDPTFHNYGIGVRCASSPHHDATSPADSDREWPTR